MASTSSYRRLLSVSDLHRIVAMSSSFSSRISSATAAGVVRLSRTAGLTMDRCFLRVMNYRIPFAPLGANDFFTRSSSLPSCHKRQHFDENDADHERRCGPRQSGVDNPRRRMSRLKTDLFFHLGAIDAGDNLLHQIGKSPIGVGDDEKPIDGRQQQIDLIMYAQTADMGDPFPENSPFSQ